MRKETNFPMLHVWEDSGFFHTTVAIPIDKKIPENETYFIKRMYRKDFGFAGDRWHHPGPKKRSGS